VLGDSDTHLAMLEAMHDRGLFDVDGGDGENEYFVVGVRANSWDAAGKIIRIFFLN
jgi:hypothetical protein